jgi:hypothetical protein
MFGSYTHILELLHAKPLLHEPQGHGSLGWDPVVQGTKIHFMIFLNKTLY